MIGCGGASLGVGMCVSGEVTQHEGEGLCCVSEGMLRTSGGRVGWDGGGTG